MSNLSREWVAFSASAFTADGTVSGSVALSSTIGLYIGQKVFLTSSVSASLPLMVSEVIDPQHVILRTVTRRHHIRLCFWSLY